MIVLLTKKSLNEYDAPCSRRHLWSTALAVGCRVGGWWRYVRVNFQKQRSEGYKKKAKDQIEMLRGSRGKDQQDGR